MYINKVMNKFTSWVKSFFTKQYKITVYRQGDTAHIYKSEYIALKVFVMKPNHLRFRDMDKKLVEIRSSVGLDYKIEEL